MSVNLTKGQKVSLTKDNPGLNEVTVGLGWDEARPKSGFFASIFSSNDNDFDCDASAILLQSGKYVDKDDLVYFGHLKHSSGSVAHSGDNLTGGGDGDDEQININLQRVPAKYDKIVIVVNIYAAHQRHQDFGMIENAFVRVVDRRNNKELLRYNLTENYKGMTAMVFAEIYRNNGEWKFNAVGFGTKDGSINELTRRYQ